MHLHPDTVTWMTLRPSQESPFQRRGTDDLNSVQEKQQQSEQFPWLLSSETSLKKKIRTENTEAKKYRGDWKKGFN